MSLRRKFVKNHSASHALDAKQSLSKLLIQCYDETNAPRYLSQAFAIYNGTDRAKRVSMMNIMFKVCLHYKRPDRVHILWPDLVQQHSGESKQSESDQQDKGARISYPLLLSCCIQSENQTLGDCIQVLQWMNSTKYHLNKRDEKDFSRNITTMLSRCIDPSFKTSLQQIYLLIPKNLITMDIYISTALMNAYSRCDPNSIDSILEIFDSIYSDVQNAYSLCSMMRALMDHQQHSKCLSLYHQYPHLHDALTHSFALKSCIASNDYNTGCQIITNFIADSKCITTSIGKFKNAMIEFYGHFHDIHNAQNTFYSMDEKERDSISVTNIMKAAVACNQPMEALNIFERFNSLQDTVSTIIAIKLCAEIKDFDRGKKIISTASPQICGTNKFRNCLIDFYGRCGEIDAAQRVFDDMGYQSKLLKPDVVTLNSMMTVLVNNGHYFRALSLYHESSDHDHVDDVSHLLALKASMNVQDINNGLLICQRVQCKLSRDRIIELNNAMIDFYGTFVDVENAENIFHEMEDSQKDSISLNTMMKVYVTRNLCDKALSLYNDYRSKHNNASHVLAIKACTQSGNVNEGKRIHGTLEWNNNNKNVEIMNTLIHFYGHNGDINAAKKVFDGIGDGDHGKRDIVTLGTMLETYCFNEMHEECIQLFEKMEMEYRLKPDVICISIVLEVCGRSAMLDFGQRLHWRLKEDADLKCILSETHIQSKLINLYGKSGMLTECESIFESVDKSNIDLCNVMMNVYAKNAAPEKVKEIFEAMKMDEKMSNPDAKSYVMLFHSLSHSGEGDEALRVWREIQDDGIKMDLYVVTSLIDGMSRKAMLREAFDIVIIHDFDHWPMWLALLSGCRTHGDEQMGSEVYEQIQTRFSGDDHVLSSALSLLKQIRD